MQRHCPPSEIFLSEYFFPTKFSVSKKKSDSAVRHPLTSHSGIAIKIVGFMYAIPPVMNHKLWFIHKNKMKKKKEQSRIFNICDKVYAKKGSNEMRRRRWKKRPAVNLGYNKRKRWIMYWKRANMRISNYACECGETSNRPNFIWNFLLCLIFLNQNKTI